MQTRPLLITLGAATALTIGLIAPATAQAAPVEQTPRSPKPLEEIAKSMHQAVATGDDCSITDVAPTTVTAGVKPATVQFDVATDCDDSAHAMKWAVTGELYRGSHVGWFGACTYKYTGPASLTCPDGSTSFDLVGTGQFQGNQMAGTQNAYVYAFDDANGNDRDDDTSFDCDDDGNCTSTSSGRDNVTTGFALLRETDWNSTFTASATEVEQGGELTLAGDLSRADWDTGAYENYSPTVKLQFKAKSETKFRSVRTIVPGAEQISVTINARRSGSFRFFYPGDGKSAPSTSNSARVTVTR
ncbi:hypothetical protein GCM10022223_21780 [Kineosporia mesophila]|uniref:Uncharacterized protein n=1 Tax=Kineosporia mesophila TaxID=566012 RepID=A0ABP6ZFR4_9ACTN|nr:hypothetical protein [Kineosporia mesophila]MCD5350267.1 hypothetical protein [Kineosporia mesophila]